MHSFGLDVEAFQSDLEKWNEGAAEWRCDTWNDEVEEEELEENENVEEEEEDISQRIVLQNDDGTTEEVLILNEEEAAALVSSGTLDAQDIEIMQTRDQSTNTECVFVKTKTSKESTEPTMPKGIVIKRSQTFSPSAVANKQEYICRVSSTKKCIPYFLF